MSLPAPPSSVTCAVPATVCRGHDVAAAAAAHHQVVRDIGVAHLHLLRKTVDRDIVTAGSDRDDFAA
jgi:hypothetical protein